MKFVIRFMLPFAGVLASLLLAAATAYASAVYFLGPALPSADTIRDIQVEIPLRIYSRDGRLLGQLGEKKRTPVEFDSIPDIVAKAFLAAEDDRFFEHPGFDYQGIARAAVNLIVTGSRSQGGSTITQQLARGYFLSRDRTFIRKAKELILAIRIEQEFSKQEILALYLNRIFLGQRAYGVAAAAEVYFGKKLGELDVAEAATIAGLPKAPSTTNPVSNPQRATERRSYVLRRMQELGFIEPEAFGAALAKPMESNLHRPRVELKAPYVREMVRQEMVRRFGLNVYKDGYRVVTTIDSERQTAADAALRRGILEYDRRHGYRGPLEREALQKLTGPDADLAYQELAERAGLYLEEFPEYRDLPLGIVMRLGEDESAEVLVRGEGLVTIAWEGLAWPRHVNDDVISGPPEKASQVVRPGDVIYVRRVAEAWQLAQFPEAQGAIVALDPYDGAITAISGGFDFYASKFNRAVQSRRQPGSAFKPFIYSAALENGYTASSIINDAPIVIDDPTLEDTWRPQNSTERFYGPTRMREGLVRSLNLLTVRLLLQMGIRPALRHLEAFALPESALPADPSLALGSGGASPLDIAAGYAVFASGGYRTSPYLVGRVFDSTGRIVHEADPAIVCTTCSDKWFDGRVASGRQPEAGRNTLRRALPEEELFTSDADAAEELTSVTAEGYTGADFTTDDTSIATVNPQDAVPVEPANIAPRAISAQNAWLMYDMMRDVITRGTGRRARQLERQDIAGKTGTSDDQRDAWFSGFNGELVTTTWIGFDQDRSLGAGEEGSRAALPVWIYFMGEALRNRPEQELAQPPGIVTARISSRTGLTTVASDRDAMFEVFRDGHVPAGTPDVDLPDIAPAPGAPAESPDEIF